MSYNRKQIEKKRLKKLYSATKGSIWGGAYFDKEKNSLIRFYKSDYKCYKFLKKQFHKKLRRSETLNNKEYDLKYKTI